MKQNTFRISLCILLGLVTSFVVAWAIAYFFQFDNAATAQSAVEESYNDMPTTPTEHLRSVHRLRHVGAEQVSVFRSKSVAISAQMTATVPSRLFPRWGAAYLGVDRNGDTISTDAVHAPDSGFIRSVVSYGWPVETVWGGLSTPIFYGQPVDPRTNPRLETRSGFIETDLPIGLIPYHPILSGLLINTLLYGTAWLLLFMIPGIFIRWGRRRDGRCPKCGYDMRGTLANRCPECGAIGD